MSAALADSIARIARHEAQARPVAAVARVTDLHPPSAAQPDYAVTVELRDRALVLPRMPLAHGLAGFGSVPEVNELVVVLFVEGDFHAPVVVGRLYDPDRQPPPHEPGQVVLALPPHPAEPKLTLTVEGAAPSLELVLGEQPVRVSLNDETVTVQAGGVTLTLDSGGQASLAAGGSSVTLKQDGDISLTSATKLTLEAPEIAITGSAKVSVTGGQVAIN